MLDDAGGTPKDYDDAQVGPKHDTTIFKIHILEARLCALCVCVCVCVCVHNPA